MQRFLLLMMFGITSMAMAQTATTSNATSPITSELRFEEMLDIALKNNIDVNLAYINQQQAEIDLLQSKLNLTPSLTGNAGQFYQSGRSIDRFTNQFVQKTIGSNNFQLQGSWVLFAGSQNRNAYKQSQELAEASGWDVKAQQYTLTLLLAQAYVQHLQALEQKKAAERLVAASELQVKKAEIMFKEGGSNKGAYLSVKAQLANNLSTLTTANNTANQTLLALKQVMRVKLTQPLLINDAGFGLQENDIAKLDKVEAQAIFDSLLIKRPEYQAAFNRLDAARYAVKVAKGSLYPTLSLGANLSTVYSDNAKSLTGYTISGTQAIGYLPSTMEAVYAPTFDYQMKTIAFNKQLKDNFGQSLGLNLSIPIYQGLRNHNQISYANLALDRAELNLVRIAQNAENDIFQVVANYKNAKERMQATLENHQMQKENLEYVLLRHEQGAASMLELQIAQNNEANAHWSYISARHEWVFRAFVLDFYRKMASGDAVDAQSLQNLKK